MAAAVKSGFVKAMIVPKQGVDACAPDQNLLDTEPEWALLKQLLEEVPVIRHFVDPNRDIETLVPVVADVDSEAL